MRRRVVALGGAALVVGCTVGPNYRPPTTAVPASFAEPQPAPGATLDPAAFWRAVGDPELDRLVTRALADSPDMAIAASRVRQARLQEIAARAAGLPQVNASAETTHVEFSENAGFSSIARLFSGGAGGGAGGAGGGSSAGGGAGGGSGSGIALPGSGITTYALGFDASWELDLFGGVRRQVEGARARTEAAEWSRRDAAVTLSGEVAQAYFALRLDQAQANILRGEVDRQTRALQIAGNRSRFGLVPQVDITRQRAQLTGTQARLEPVTADIRVRIHALGILVGADPASLSDELTGQVPALGPLPTVPAGLPSDLLRRRPDVRAAERALAAATADIGVAVADLYPRFSLTGMAQLISTSLSSLFERDSLQLTGTGAVQFPLVDFGRRRAAVRSREEDREQAYQRYRQTVLGALRDVEDPLAQIDAERRRNATLIRAVNDAAASAHATEAQYRTGFVAQNALLDAETDVLTAREQLASSDAQLRQLTVTLFKAIGGGWSEQVATEAPD